MDMDGRATPSAQGEEDFQLPALSFDSTPTSRLATPSLVRRQGSQRITSPRFGSSDEHRYSAIRRPSDGDASAEGLAISNVELHREHSMAGGTLDNQATPDPAESVISPMMGRVDDYGGLGGKGDELKHVRSMSFTSSSYQPFLAVPDTGKLTPKSPATTLGSHEPLMYNSSSSCKSKRNIHKGRLYWFSIVLLGLSIYSTLFSVIWFVVAAHKPRYGERISTKPGRLAPANASILFAALAKSIELSFVTVFVAFLGQVLSRRALAMKSGGISIAEMSARSWVMQPGTMITHFGSVRFAGRSILGMLSLAATLVAIFYTTASDTLGKQSTPFAIHQRTILECRLMLLKYVYVEGLTCSQMRQNSN